MANEKVTGTGLLIMAVLVVGTLVGLGGWLLGGQGQSAASGVPVTDVIVIDAMAVFGTLERPPAVFRHDRHTERLAADDPDGKVDCTACHLADTDGRISVMFNRRENIDQDAVQAAYHDRCIGCHDEHGGAAPRTEACGVCHVAEPTFVSARAPAGFDNSLHQRHVDANEKDCDHCHHTWDPAAEKLTYVKGQEESCRSCHRDQQLGRVSALRSAAHTHCVNCHLLRESVAGPVTCAGCHDAQERQQILVLDEVPRLERGQPDRVLVHAAPDDLPQMKMPTVPLDHLHHENAVTTCRACHHETLAACNVCHTLQGIRDGGDVTLAVAYHTQTSEHSCIGCHELRKDAAECAGCHAPMPTEALADRYCDRCHRGPSPEEVAAADGQLTPPPEPQRPPLVPLALTGDDDPETVVIGHLAKEYAPTVFPHRKVVEKLRAGIEASDLARRFHGRDDLLCQGCHHRSPSGQRPPLCESCHGAPFQQKSIHAPGLFGALHQQCIGCHQQMNLRTDCTFCHAEKTEELAEVR